MKFKPIILLMVLLISSTGNATVIQKQIKNFLEKINTNDKPNCHASNEMFINSAFQQILLKNPSVDELENSLIALGEYGPINDGLIIERSDLLSFLFAQKYEVEQLNDGHLEKELRFIQNFDPCHRVSYLKNQADIVDEDLFDKLNEDTDYRLKPAAHTEKYGIYYGYLHSHTGVSDGEGDPSVAYTMARDEAKIDFLAVTDHAIQISRWPWNNEWKKSKNFAQEFTDPGKFVAIHGFEWSSPIFGHISIINSKNRVNCLQKPTMKSLYRWIVKQDDDVFARYNHPGRTDFLGYDNQLEFSKFKLYPKAIKYMAGIEMFNKEGGLRRYYLNDGYDGEHSFYDDANLKGWMVGAVGGQDNHSSDWGIRNDYIVGVWAKDLTKSSIIDAYKERRTFATEDRNASISFKMNEAQMGSRLYPGSKIITVEVSDQDNEEFKTISIFKNGMLLKEFAPDKSKEVYMLEVETNSNDFFYAFAEQIDGDLILSSPIWIL